LGCGWMGEWMGSLSTGRKTVKNRNRNHIFFISSIVGRSWSEVVSESETESTCFALTDRETFGRDTKHTHTYTQIEIAI